MACVSLALLTRVIHVGGLFHPLGREAQSAALAETCAVPFGFRAPIGRLVSLRTGDAWIATSAQGPALPAQVGTSSPVWMRGTQPDHEQCPDEDRDQGFNEAHGEIADPLSMKSMLKHVTAQKGRLVGRGCIRSLRR